MLQFVLVKMWYSSVLFRLLKSCTSSIWSTL